jgi:type IV pilus assembly protein PilQ
VGAHELSTPPVALPVEEIEPEPVTPTTVAFEPIATTPEPEYQVADASLSSEPEPAFVRTSYQDEVAEGGAAPAAPQPQTFSSRTVSAGAPTYTGAPMSISLKDGDIKDVLRSFAQISGLNIVVQPGVTGTVTVELTDVPWDQALEEILKINGLGYVLEGNIMRVAPIKVLADEAAERQRLAQANALSVPLKTIMKRISYAEASTMAGILMSGGGASLVSQRGSVVVDSRTNTLIIKELPDYIDTVLAVIETLDVPEPQVMIEARIIETTKRFNRTLGIQWGFNGISSPAYGNTTGLQFPNQGSVDGSVNLLTGGSNGLLDISLGNVLGTFSIDATLQAAEDEGLINILSAPKVATLNNEQASIQSGLQIPIQTVANNTVSVQFVNATLRLDVTPHVTAEGTVLMDINIQKREPLLAFTVVGATNAPIATKDARTRVIVRDGGTTVIGGIYKVTSDQGEDRVPGLANIPVLGHLFKNKRRSDENEELLIFITPRVIKL